MNRHVGDAVNGGLLEAVGVNVPNARAICHLSQKKIADIESPA